MTPSTPMTPSTKTPPIQRPAASPRERGPAAVVPFRAAPSRRFRREEDGPLGQILLFTGVRYERLPDADASAVPKRRRS